MTNVVQMLRKAGYIEEAQAMGSITHIVGYRVEPELPLHEYTPGLEIMRTIEYFGHCRNLNNFINESEQII
ncbi:hypothetical protein FH603_5496 [Spirosoma sp. LMG 31447]|uniref:Uncharacterized protein n=1 Tax=Spirosoma utsteinense TaxID=2585773 RepID=A0ABR6WEM7_9BACT|nr:hypothetical protein [Spirosoma utsteinense]